MLYTHVERNENEEVTDSSYKFVTEMQSKLKSLVEGGSSKPN